VSRYGSRKDIQRNLVILFLDGMVFAPAMTLISITAVIPYFLHQAGATTFQIGLAASLALVCSFLIQPIFVRLASNARHPQRTFGKVLVLQRVVFLAFVLCIPLLAGQGKVLTWVFLFFWGVFNLFVGSYGVFYSPLVLRILPPDRRGAARGAGNALGMLLSVGAAALIPPILVGVAFPVNYLLIFAVGSLLLLIDAGLFFLLRIPKDAETDTPMTAFQYVRQMPGSIRRNAPFRALVAASIFLVIPNSLLAYYTIYAISVFGAAESQIGRMAVLAAMAGAVGYFVFGLAVDRWGPRLALLASAYAIILAGALALTSHSLMLLYVAWVLANVGTSAYMIAGTLLLGLVSPPTQVTLHVGTQSAISLALSALVVLLLAPLLEHIGFGVLFAIVLVCGFASLIINVFGLRKHLVAASDVPAPIRAGDDEGPGEDAACPRQTLEPAHCPVTGP